MHSLFQRIDCHAPPKVKEWAEALGGHFTMLNRLYDTPQDLQWHGEGNAGIHTDLVLAELGAMLGPGGEGRHLSPERQRLLILAGLFHDIGKILTTSRRRIDGETRIISPRHPAKGRSWFAKNHHGVGLPWLDIETVLGGIGHHHDPRRLISDDAGEFAFRKLARLCDLELVYMLGLADLRGRISPTQGEEIERLELFRMAAEEYRLFSGADPWQDWRKEIERELAGCPEVVIEHTIQQGIREAESGKIFTPQEALARSYQWRTLPPCEFVILCGPSGSGKSTWAARNRPGYAVISLDAWREKLGGKPLDKRLEDKVKQAAKSELRECLRQRQSVIWDATSLSRDRRASLIQLGLDYHVFVRLVAFSIPLKELKRRNQTRADSIPAPAQSAQFDRFDWPFASEAHALESVACVEDAISSGKWP